MKVVIQIPCYNEAENLGATLADLPRQLDGADEVEWLVVDDGSEDATVRVARAHGVDHVVELGAHRGLAEAFLAGVRAALRAGADVIVNTDADNQYSAADIPKLIAPILDGRADIVIGRRPIEDAGRFSRGKTVLNRIGTWLVRLASRTEVFDAPSGFRAISKEAARRLNVFDRYTYTLETIIQAGREGMSVTSVPVGVNPDVRPSRLIRSIPEYLRRSTVTIVRSFVTYRPLRFFAVCGVVVLGLGVGVLVHHLATASQRDEGRLSPILAIVLIGTGLMLGIAGFLADLIAVNRRLCQDIQRRLQELEERIE